MNKKTITEVTATTEMVQLFKTTYHYYRNWVRGILQQGKITNIKFLKEKIGWKGIISVPKSQLEKAKQVLNEYKKKHPDAKELWW